MSWGRRLGLGSRAWVLRLQHWGPGSGPWVWVCGTGYGSSALGRGLDLQSEVWVLDHTPGPGVGLGLTSGSYSGSLIRVLGPTLGHYWVLGVLWVVSRPLGSGSGDGGTLPLLLALEPGTPSLAGAAMPPLRH